MYTCTWLVSYENQDHNHSAMAGGIPRLTWLLDSGDSDVFVKHENLGGNKVLIIFFKYKCHDQGNQVLMVHFIAGIWMPNVNPLFLMVQNLRPNRQTDQPEKNFPLM